MSWILLCLSALVAVGTWNALWPLRRPWWLKLPSFNAGWFVNEMPFHVLAGQSVLVVILAWLGALDDLPGQIGVVLSAMSAVGLVVLGAAHRRAGRAIDETLQHIARPGEPSTAERPVTAESAAQGRSLPRSWLVLPWLTWFRTPGVERVAGVVYTTIAGRELELDLYLPVGRPHGCPVLVEIHGGGWIAGDRRVEGRPLMTHMAARGWVCVSVDYRVGKSATWPDQIVDVKVALAWVRDQISSYGGDPDFVAVTGGSAGGHLAALAALTPDDPDFGPQSGTAATIRACVPFYGPYDFDNSLGIRPPGEMHVVERFVVKDSLAENPTLFERGSPLARVNQDAPPFLVIQGTSDNLVFSAESRAFVERLRSTSRAVVAYVEVPRAHHAFDIVPSVRTGHVVAGVDRFLTHTYAQHRRTAPSSTSGRGAGSGAP